MAMTSRRLSKFLLVTLSSLYLAACYPPTVARPYAASHAARAVELAPRASCPLGPSALSQNITSNDGTFYPYRNYESAPFQPPVFQISRPSQQRPLAPGLLFLTPSDFRPTGKGTKDQAPLIFTDAGQLVWNGPPFYAANLQMATYKGKPILSYWQGVTSAGGNIGHGYGNVTYLDTSYNTILTVCPKFNLHIPGAQKVQCEADFHESFVTDRDTLIVSAYNATPADLSPLGGPKDGWVFDCLFFELEPATGRISFRWSAIEHVPVTDTKQPLAGTGNASVPFDYFHINSVAVVGAGFLVDARHTWTMYHVRGADGGIAWRIQGETGGDFGPLPVDGHFRWQHHPRPHNATKDSLTISMFNNYNSAVDNGTHPTNGLFLTLPLPPGSKPVTVRRRLEDPARPLYAESQGSTQLLPGGNVLMDYGQVPLLREYAPVPPGSEAAPVLWEARFGGILTQGYRGFKQEWHAVPAAPPSLVVKAGAGAGGCNEAYASWNGATDVTAWAVYQGQEPGALRGAGQVAHRGFETKFRVSGTYVQVAAVTSDGKVQQRSAVVKAS